MSELHHTTEQMDFNFFNFILKRGKKNKKEGNERDKQQKTQNSNQVGFQNKIELNNGCYFA